MHPRIWGRDMWSSIHFVALGYPAREPSDDVKLSYQTYFHILGAVLPCVRCSLHYKDHLTAYPVGPSLVGRSELFRWTVDLHNAVNASVGRDGWTYEQAYAKYSDRRTSLARPGEGRRQVVEKTVTVVLSSLLLVVFLIWWFGISGPWSGTRDSR